MEEVISAIRDVVDNAEVTREFLKRAKRVKERAEGRLVTARKELADLKSPQMAENAFQISVSQTLQEAPEILKSEIETAVLKNDEYAYTALLIPLLDVANDTELYEILAYGGGWAMSITVNLLMDEIAGNIQDYADAVQSTREELNVGRSNPKKASDIWRNRIYPTRGKSGPYGHTISTRLSYMASQAPYWSLLNDGNKTGSMSSDRGGTPFPSHAGTHFVQHAEEKIRKIFRIYFSGHKEQNRSDIALIKDQMDYVTELLGQLDSTIYEIEENLDNAKSVARRLGKTMDQIDNNKLLDVVERVRSGELTSGRVNIGKRGSRVRISVSRIAALEY